MSKILNIHAESGPVSLHGTAAAAPGRHKKAALHIHTVAAGTCEDVQVDWVLTKRFCDNWWKMFLSNILQYFIY